jgi:hypothetical protein
VPNLSRSMAKRLAKGVSSIFMKISPPSASRAYTRSASASLVGRQIPRPTCGSTRAEHSKQPRALAYNA